MDDGVPNNSIKYYENKVYSIGDITRHEFIKFYNWNNIFKQMRVEWINSSSHMREVNYFGIKELTTFHYMFLGKSIKEFVGNLEVMKILYD